MSNEWKDWTFDAIQEKINEIGLDKIEKYNWLGNNDFIFSGYHMKQNGDKVYATIRYNNNFIAYCMD